MLKQPAARILYRNNNAFDLKQNLQNHKNQNHQNQKVDQYCTIKILNKPDSIAQLTRKLQIKEKRPVIIY